MKKFGFIVLFLIFSLAFSQAVSAQTDEVPADFEHFDDNQKDDGAVFGDEIEVNGIAESYAKAAALADTGEGELIICIDPGHGGTDGGSTMYSGTLEKACTLELSLLLKNELEKYEGVKVILTRDTDKTLSLYQRAEYAGNNNADLLISMHTDASINENAKGISLFYPNANYRPDLSTSARNVCTYLKTELNDIGFTTFAGIKTRTIDADDPDYIARPDVYGYPDGTLGDYYGIIRYSKNLGFAAIIVEHGFGTNKDDYTNYLSTTEQLKTIAKADARGLAAAYGLEMKKIKIGYNFEEINGEWLYTFNGDPTSTTSIVKGTINGEFGWWRVVDGKADFSCTGIEKNEYGWWRIVNGKVDFNCNSVEKNQYGWWYIENGKVNFDYNGLGENSLGKWFIKNGKVDFEHTGIEKCGKGWYKFKGGKVEETFTGISNNAYGWWFIIKGCVDFEYAGVEKGTVNNSEGWWKITGGRVDFNCSSVEHNANGWWYIENGKVDFSYNGLGENANGIWFIKNGKVEFGHTGIEKCGKGWYKFKDGRLENAFTGISNNAYGWWYVVKGCVDFNFTSIEKGTVNHESGWWYIKNGQVKLDHTGVDKNIYGWWRVENGKVNLSYNGLAENANGMWVIENGKVNFNYNGLYKADNETWYVTGGRVDYSFTGKLSDGRWVVRGKLVG